MRPEPYTNMPQSLSIVYIHLVFSTKERRSFLRDPGLRASVHGYLGEISKRLDCPPIQVGGVEDHIHLLARFGRTITQAEWIKELKRISNEWLKEQGIPDFKWQGGYADFSVINPILRTSKRIFCGKRNTTEKRVFRINCGRACADSRWNGTSGTFGIKDAAQLKWIRQTNWINQWAQPLRRG